MGGSKALPDVLQFSLDTSPETFAKSTRDLVTGEVSVRLGNRPFPDAHWNDFVVVIMGWWLEEFLKIVTGVVTTCSCRFDDGRSVEQLAQGLRNSTIKPAEIPPIRLVVRDGQLFTLDNRRLLAFQTAGVDVPCYGDS